MRHRQGSERGWVLAVAAVLAFALVLTAVGVSFWLRQDRTVGGRTRHPAAVLPSPVAPVLVPDTGHGAMPSAAGLLRALAGPTRDPRLGGRVSYAVTDGETGAYLTGRNPAQPTTPASVAKLTSAVAALAAVGPQARIPTRVVAGAAPGEVVLVGGGDPTLSVNARQAYPGAARLDVLAAAVRRAYGAPVTRLVVDGSAYSGPAAAPGWDTDLVTSGNVAPITAVMVDGGRIDPLRHARTTTPDLAAGRALARLLGASTTAVVHGVAPPGARELAKASSAPMSILVEQTLTASDNVLAEALARQVAMAKHAPASFGGAAGAVVATLTGLGVAVAGLHLVDGSGLSRANRVTAALLAGLLTLAARGHPELRSVLTGLPVAGFSGTLDDRFRLGSPKLAAGEVRAKTGTLSGVSTLAGVVRDTDGRLLVFAVLADRVPAGGTLGAEAALDQVAATIARCGCR